MFEAFTRSCKILREQGLEDSFVETLRLFDLLSGGRLSTIDVSRLEEPDLDLKRIAELRNTGVPMEYIVGRAVFMGMSFHCTPDTLIPRKETELLVSSTLDLIRARKNNDGNLAIMELGIGCGNITVALAMNAPNVKIHASDICPKAVEVARKNVISYGLDDRISLSCGNLFAPFDTKEYGESIDIVVCNPPYIPTGSIEKMDSAITEHEPILALDAGAYGIDIFRRLIAGAVPYLKSGGILIFEIGAGQEKLVNMLFKKNKAYENVTHTDDGNDVRVISAQKK